LQVAQLVAEQVLQLLPMPGIEMDPPSSLLEEAEKVERSFRAAVLHLGHSAALSASLKERRSSNLQLQLGHIYS
jgi:hypothetical protein